MDITLSKSGAVRVIALKGQLDAAAVPEFERVAGAEVAAGSKHVVLDLTELTFVGSAGLGAFVTLSKQVSAGGGGARFCGLNESVKKLFDITGVSFRLPIFPTREEALKAFP